MTVMSRNKGWHILQKEMRIVIPRQRVIECVRDSDVKDDREMTGYREFRWKSIVIAHEKIKNLWFNSINIY